MYSVSCSVHSPVPHWFESGDEAENITCPQGLCLVPGSVSLSAGVCREQLVHQLKLEEKEHEEKLEREKSKKLAELEVREGGCKGGREGCEGQWEGCEGGWEGGMLSTYILGAPPLARL